MGAYNIIATIYTFCVITTIFIPPFTPGPAQIILAFGCAMAIGSGVMAMAIGITNMNRNFDAKINEALTALTSGEQDYVMKTLKILLNAAHEPATINRLCSALMHASRRVLPERAPEILGELIARGGRLAPGLAAQAVCENSPALLNLLERVNYNLRADLGALFRLCYDSNSHACGHLKDNFAIYQTLAQIGGLDLIEYLCKEVPMDMLSYVSSFLDEGGWLPQNAYPPRLQIIIMYYTWNQNKYYRPVTEIRSDMFVDLLRNMRTWALDSAVSNRVDVAVKTLALRVFKRWPSEPEIMLIERTTVHTQPTVYGVAPDGYMRLPS